MAEIVHFQEKLQHAICVNRRTPNLVLTFERSSVTCGNCLERLRRKSFGPVDWKGLYTSLKEKLPIVELRVKEFCFSHPEVKGNAKLTDGPPQIEMEFWFPAPVKTRRKTIGHNFGPYSDSDVRQILIPNEDEMSVVATFVGKLGEEFSWNPRRHPERRDEAILAYQLRPKYRS